MVNLICLNTYSPIRLHRQLMSVMYIPLSINSDWIGDIQTVFSDLLLMLQKLFSWENVPLQTQ